MRLTSVEIHPANSSNFAVLSFQDFRRQNPYNVKTIIGLDADEITSRYYGGSASKFYNLSLLKRDIVIRIELNPRFALNESYSDLRDSMYKMIASSRSGILDIHFKNGVNTIAKLSGFVKKFEAPHFTQTPELQLTIECKDPLLKAPTRTTVDVTGLDPALTTIQDNLSTAPHGFMFEVSFLGALATFSIADPNDASWVFEVSPAGGFLIGDILHFSSEQGEKFIYIERGLDTIYLADVITSGSVWPILFPGDNVFAIENPASVQWDAISYCATYWGV